MPVLLAVVLAGLQIQAKYPYDFVLLAMLLVLVAIRGYGAAMTRVAALGGWRRWAVPVLWLLPLGVLTEQLGYVAHISTNAHQLRLLEKVDRWSGPGDPVVDGAGGAFLRLHASYYWYHGAAHRQIYRDYFERELAGDYRESEALFRIDDFRQQALPPPVRRYFERHYIPLDGPLHVLGFRLPSGGAEGRAVVLDVVRAGSYWWIPSQDGAAGSPTDPEPLGLEVGARRLEIPPGRPASVLAAVPPEAFTPTYRSPLRFSPLFEFDPSAAR